MLEEQIENDLTAKWLEIKKQIEQDLVSNDFQKASENFPFKSQWQEFLFNNPSILKWSDVERLGNSSSEWSDTIFKMLIAYPHIFLADEKNYERANKLFNKEKQTTEIYNARIRIKEDIPDLVDVTKLFEESLEKNDLTFFANWNIIKKYLKIFPDYAERIFKFVKSNELNYLQNWMDIETAKECFPEHAPELCDLIFSNADKWFTCWTSFVEAKKMFDKEAELVEIFIKKFETVFLATIGFLEQAADFFPKHMEKWSQLLMNHPACIIRSDLSELGKPSSRWCKTVFEMVKLYPHIFLKKDEDLICLKGIFPSEERALENAFNKRDEIGQSSRFDKMGVLKYSHRSVEFKTPGVLQSHSAVGRIATAYQHYGLMRTPEIQMNIMTPSDHIVTIHGKSKK